jgi:hypothetical protein
MKTIENIINEYAAKYMRMEMDYDEVVCVLKNFLKEIEDLEEKQKYNPMGDYNPVKEFQKVIDSVKK